MSSSTGLSEIETAVLLKALDLVASHRWHKLGQHPLAHLKCVNLYRVQAQLPDDAIGHGKALSAILQRAVARLVPSRAQDVLQARLNRIPPQMAVSHMGLSLDRWYVIQRNEAIPELRTILWEMEQAADGEQEMLAGEEMARLETSAAAHVPDISRKRQDVPTQSVPFLAPAPPVHKLVGREGLLSDLKRRLLEGNHGLIALQGLPGVGKTTLAIALAHDPDIQGRFPDGVLWVGLGRQPDMLAVLGIWATALRIPAEEIARQANPTERAWRIHAAIGLRRMLLVIDDAWQVDAALALKVGGANCAHIVTTRLTSIALDLTGEGNVSVSELDTVAGIHLLEQLAPQVTCAEPQATQALVQAVGGLPLALILIGRHLRKVSGGAQTRRVRQALTQLQTAQARLQLAQLQSPLEQSPDLSLQTPLSLQASIGLSDLALDQDTRAALQSLALFPPKPNTFSEAAGLAVTGQPLDVLDMLADQGLLESSRPGRYTLHQTIADYAHLEAVNPDAARRFVRYGVQYSAEHVAENEALDLERHNLVTALELAFQHGMNVELIQGVLALQPFLMERGLYALAELYLSRALSLMSTSPDAERYTLILAREKAYDVLAKHEFQRQDLETLENLAEALDDKSPSTGGHYRAQVALRQANYARVMSDYAAATKAAHKAIELAQTTEDLVIRAEGYLQLGETSWIQADYPEARRQLEHVLLLAQKGGVSDPQPQALGASLLHLEADALRGLGNVALCQSDYAGARDYYGQSLHLYGEIGNRRGEGAILCNLGITYADLGDVRKAIEFYEQALQIEIDIGDRKAQGNILGNLGEAYIALGDSYRAIEFYERAVVILREIGDRRGEGNILVNLGLGYANLGETHRAIEFYERAVAILREIGDRRGEGIALVGLGNADANLGEMHHAIEFYERAVAILREIGNRRDEGEALWGKSQMLDRLGDRAQAIAQAKAALEIWEQIQDPRADKVRTQLAKWQEGATASMGR